MMRALPRAAVRRRGGAGPGRRAAHGSKEANTRWFGSESRSPHRTRAKRCAAGHQCASSSMPVSLGRSVTAPTGDLGVLVGHGVAKAAARPSLARAPLAAPGPLAASSEATLGIMSLGGGGPVASHADGGTQERKKDPDTAIIMFLYLSWMFQGIGENNT